MFRACRGKDDGIGTMSDMCGDTCKTRQSIRTPIARAFPYQEAPFERYQDRRVTMKRRSNREEDVGRWGGCKLGYKA